jgi:hypothetical protein
VAATLQTKPGTLTFKDIVKYVAYDGGVKKIREYEKEDFKEAIADQLQLVIEMVGIQREISETLTNKILQFLWIHYADLSPLEIEVAFDLALTGELEVKVEHYQSFDLLYLSKILEAYREYRRSVIAEAKRENEERLKANALPSADERLSAYQQAAEWVRDRFYEYIQNNAIKKSANVPFLYDVLDGCNLVDLTTDEKHSIYEQAKRKFDDEYANERVKNSIRAALMGDKDRGAKRIAKEMSIETVFERIYHNREMTPDDLEVTVFEYLKSLDNE